MWTFKVGLFKVDDSDSGERGGSSDTFPLSLLLFESLPLVYQVSRTLLRGRLMLFHLRKNGFGLISIFFSWIFITFVRFSGRIVVLLFI